MGEAKRNLEAKKKAFEDNPDMFINLKDLVIGVSFKPDQDGKGMPGILINPSTSRGLLVNALYDLNKNIDQYIMNMDHQSQESKKSGIITPGGNGKNRMGNIT